MSGGVENIVHGIRNLLSETIQTGYWSHWTLPIHSTLSAELPSLNKCRTSSPSSSNGCGSVMDNNTHTCSSEVQTQFPLPVECVRQGDHMRPFLFFCLAIQPFLEEASTQVQSLTYMDDIYLVGAPDKMPGVISSLQ